MHDIHIMVDSSADLSNETREKYGIGLIPLLSIFNEKSYVIGTEMSNEQFYDMLSKTKKLPKTSQTPYASMYDMLLKASKEHESVIYITLSSVASGQNHTAHLVRDDILENGNPNANIIIIDSMSFSILIGRTAIEMTKYVQEGYTAEEVAEKGKNYIEHLHAFILVSDLMYLEKGGRLNTAAAVLGTLLDVKPVLTISEGLIDVEAKLRGKKKIYKKLCDMVSGYETFDEDAAEFIIIDSCKEMGDELEENVKDMFCTDNGILRAEFGPLIGTNVGAGTVALVFKTKEM